MGNARIYLGARNMLVYFRVIKKENRNITKIRKANFSAHPGFEFRFLILSSYSLLMFGLIYFSGWF
jgi:hypothetical protein